MNVTDLKAKIETYLGQEIKILFTATILRNGWEFDNYAWLVETKGGKRFIMSTDHGSLYQMSAPELQTHINAHQSALGELLSIQQLKADKPKTLGTKKRKAWVKYEA